MTAEQVRVDIERMQASIADLQGQMVLWRQRIAELQEDRTGLEGFDAQVRSERGQFESTLGRKRQAASRAGYVANSRIAMGVASMMSARFSRSFESNVNNCYAGVRGEIKSAISKIDQEIRQLEAQIASAETEISGTRRRIASAQAQYERLRTEEG